MIAFTQEKHFVNLYSPNTILPTKQNDMGIMWQQSSFSFTTHDKITL